MATHAPVASRITSIDALRGFALFGVLLVNVMTGFRGPMLLHGGTPPAGSADAFTLSAIQLLVEGKSIAIFSMLFGVGLAIQHEALSRRGPEARLLVRRLVLLFGFGLAHFILWSGDVLTVYALAGLIALPLLLGRPTSWFLPIAAVVFVVATLLPAIPVRLPMPDKEWIMAHMKTVGDVLANGSFAEITRMRWSELSIFAISDLFLAVHTVALLLIGAWAWRSGLLLPGENNELVLRRVAMVGLPVGAALTLINKDWPVAVELPRWGERLLGDLAPLVLAMGYASAFLLLLSWRGKRLSDLLAPIGRMAFTNYLSQTVILAILFYGYGFGLSGKLGVIACLGVAIAIFAMQMAWSRWWLARHRFGPLEWLWRSGMYGRWQPWRRPAETGPQG